jgi:hypothetical protein
MIELSAEKRRRVAFHEAGHAWMMWKEGLGVKSVSMEPHRSIQGDNRGETVPDLAIEEGHNELSQKFAKAALAGSAAEHFLQGKWDEDSLQASTYDTRKARGFLAMSKDNRDSESLDHDIQALSNSVMGEISRPREWHNVTDLAYALLASGTLTGEQVLEILADW